MLTRAIRPLATAALLLAACGGTEPTYEESVASTTQPLAGALAVGSIPAGMPARLGVGLFEGLGGTWLKNSGAPWDYRYQYFTKGWVNNWGWGAYDGSWA